MKRINKFMLAIFLVFCLSSSSFADGITIQPRGAKKGVNDDITELTGLTTPLTVAQGGQGASTLTDGGVLLGSGTGAVTPMAVLADGEIIVGDGTTDPVAESGATARTSLGSAASGANADITSTTALTQITRATGGALDIAIGSASGDNFTVDTDKLVVEGDTGNTGFGVAAPAHRVDLLGTINMTAGSELVLNGDFTTDTDPPPSWTAAGGGTTTLTTEAGGQSGNCMKVTSTSGGGYAYQSFTTEIGRIYYFSAYGTYAPGGATGGTLKVGSSQGGSQYYTSGVVATAAWTQYAHVFKAVSTTTFLSFYNSTAGNAYYYDTITVTEMPSVVFDDDTDTYWWHPSSDTLAASTGGTERLRIASSGLVTLTNNLKVSGTAIDMVTSGTTLTVGVGADNGTVSAGIFTDRTKFFVGDAITEINTIKGGGGHIDHKTLPKFAQVKLTKPVWGDIEIETEEGIKIEKIKIGEKQVIERDLGAMISILTVAVQQLSERIVQLEAKIN